MIALIRILIILGLSFQVITWRENFTYILLWEHLPYKSVFDVVGTKYFQHANCLVNKCYMTYNRNYLGDIRNFDVILFFGVKLHSNRQSFYNALEIKRSPKQNYVYMNQESSQNFPLCYKELDGFFNMTWTYKLNSDLFYPYFVVKNKKGDLIGPQKDVHWIKIEDMKPLHVDIEEKLEKKFKAVAWIVSNCKSQSKREKYVTELIEALDTYQLTVDIYGKCGTLMCGKPKMLLPDCWEIIENDYYFYLAFENSFAEDYVTEKILGPLKNYTVPIVYGTANYTRFMPDGIYINAMEMTPQQLAAKIFELTRDKKKYFDFFKWHSHYSFHQAEEFPNTDNLCRFCEIINDETYMRSEQTIQDFKSWWNNPGACDNYKP